MIRCQKIKKKLNKKLNNQIDNLKNENNGLKDKMVKIEQLITNEKKIC